MNYLSQQGFQGTLRKFIRLFVSTEQKKFIATVDAFEQNLSEQIANSYVCTFEQFQTETCSNRYVVTNIRQNGFSVIIPKELNIGQVLNDQSYITCKICKDKNKNKRMNNCQRTDKQSKKTQKEQYKIEINLPDISPPQILTSNNIPQLENKIEKNQQNPKKKNKRKKKNNQQVQNKFQQIIDEIQNNQIQQNFFNDKLQCISQSKEQIVVKDLKSQVQLNEKIELQERIDNIYCDTLISQNKQKNQQVRNDNLESTKQEDLHQNTLSQVNNQKNNLQITNKIFTNNESNLLLKDTFDYFQDSLNISKDLPRVPNCSFQTNIEHSTRYKKEKQNQNNLKQQQNNQFSNNKRQNYILNQSINQSNYNNHKNKKKCKNDI